MAPFTESQTLAYVMDQARELSGMYMKLLSEKDLHQVFEIDGQPLNTAFWIMAHLPVTQNYLLLRSTGAEHVKIPWARQFGMGSSYVPIESCPPLEEVLSVMKEVHEKSLAHISQLDQQFLDQPNTSGFDFFGVNSVRHVIIHAIRHEGIHAGHLGWLCKLHGIKTI